MSDNFLNLLLATSPCIIDSGPFHAAFFKPHNLACVGGQGVPRPTMLDHAREQLGPNIFPVHRLDKVTSGVILFARSNFAQLAMQDAFKKHLVKKFYYCLVENNFANKKLIISHSLKKTYTKSKKNPLAKQIVCNSGIKAQTNFKLVKNLGSNFALVQAQPISGRMHQIRAHLAHIGHPLVGDKLYGAQTRLKQAHTIGLCATMLEFPLPKNGKAKIDLRSIFNYNFYLDKQISTSFLDPD